MTEPTRVGNGVPNTTQQAGTAPPSPPGNDQRRREDGADVDDGRQRRRAQPLEDRLLAAERERDREPGERDHRAAVGEQRSEQRL